jgi:molybdopterin converting factor small subunit
MDGSTPGPLDVIMPVVFIPSLLRSYSDGRSKVAVSGATLRQVFDNLEAECPGIRARIVDDGRIRPEISVSVDNELIDTGLLYPVAETSEVYLLPAISGGACALVRVRR